MSRFRAQRRLLALILATTAFAAPAASAAGQAPQVQAPAQADAPPVRAGKAWLAANKIADDAAFAHALHDLWPAAPGTPAQWIQFRDQVSAMQFVAADKVDGNKARLWLFDPDMNGYLTADVAVQPDDPRKLAGIRIVPSPDLPPGVAPAARLAEPALIAAVQARAEHDTAAGRFSGAVLIARNGHVLFEHAYGLADREARIPNRLDTQFRFGSMGKMFTAIAIMQLIEAGKVDPEAPIGRYLPGYAEQAIATKVTVANLLTHTGGTGDIFGPQFDANKATLRDPKDYVALYQMREPLFPAGSRVAYSNYGFVLLGRIVETVGGQSYDDYLRQHIFAPAGMASTGNQPESVKLPRRAVGYIGVEPVAKRADDTLPLRGSPAGGGYSTVGDFERFTEALVGGRLIKPETLDALLHGGVKVADGSFVSYDFGGTMPGMGRFIGHSGGAPGMNGELIHFLDTGYTIVVLANRLPPQSASGMVRFAASRLPVK